MIWKTSIGGFMLYAIEDGAYHVDPLPVFPNSDPDAWEGERSGADGTIRISIGCFLITDGDQIVMVDSGMGRWPEAPAGVRASVGLMPKALETLEVSPGDVEMVVHTHLHADHFGGDVTDDGKPFFPNARLMVHRSDLDYFREAEGWLADRVRTEFLPLVEDDRVDLLDSAKPLASGIRVERTPGHTPGHLSVLIESEESQAMILGDVAHHPLQMRHPSWNSAGDVDPELAYQTRTDTVQRLAETGDLLAAGHFPKPGFGHVHQEGEYSRFVPITATAVA